MESICVFAASSPGVRPTYAAAARELAQAIAGRRARLVYGGANVGLMGVLADEALALGAEVIGVMPRDLVDYEIAHPGLTELHVVDSMHERKAMMADLSDAVVALPGGWGTLEELFEIVTWAQLGLHGKPCGVYNVVGYFDGLLAFLDHAVAERLLRPQHRDLLLADADLERLFERMAAYEPPAVEKWIDREST